MRKFFLQLGLFIAGFSPLAMILLILYLELLLSNFSLGIFLIIIIPHSMKHLTSIYIKNVLLPQYVKHDFLFSSREKDWLMQEAKKYHLQSSEYVEKMNLLME